MASQSSSSSRCRRSNVQRRELLCNHGQKPILRVLKTKENPGRRFWGCMYYEVCLSSSIFDAENPFGISDSPSASAPDPIKTLPRPRSSTSSPSAISTTTTATLPPPSTSSTLTSTADFAFLSPSFSHNLLYLWALSSSDNTNAGNRLSTLDNRLLNA
ncbi:hypothetical protein PIB30_104333, partial [Stylosanthes scabra]|nr:hypothetical protein [Stylosanthes scabra]